MSFEIFQKNASALQYKFAMANCMADFGNDENSPRSSRVIRRHRIGRSNVAASVSSGKAFLLMECIKKCRAVQGRAYGREFILSSMRRCLTGRDFTRKKVRH